VGRESVGEWTSTHEVRKKEQIEVMWNECNQASGLTNKANRRDGDTLSPHNTREGSERKKHTGEEGVRGPESSSQGTRGGGGQKKMVLLEK